MQPDRAVQRTALLSEAWEMLKQTYAEWSDDDAAQLAAALAYYTIFSLAPLLIVAIALAGLVFGREAVQGELVKYIATLIGPEGAEAIQELIANARKPTDSVWASIIGFVVLLFGASGVVGQLKAALNRIWDIETKSAQLSGGRPPQTSPGTPKRMRFTAQGELLE